MFNTQFKIKMKLRFVMVHDGPSWFYHTSESVDIPDNMLPKEVIDAIEGTNYTRLKRVEFEIEK